MQAMILAGGAGTRLRSVLGENLNKPMAPIAEKPFLEYLIMRLRTQNINNIILCVGYKADLIESYFRDGHAWGVQLVYSRETDFLGTGGAVKLAEDLVRDDEFLVMNGDSFFDVDLNDLIRFHREARATATLALAQVENTQRYGAVRLDEANRIVAFVEKGETAQSAHAGLINAGVYVLSREVLRMIPHAQVCSLEREVFPALVAVDVARSLYGQPSHGFFIDIGIPSDYQRLQDDPAPLFAACGASGEESQRTW